MHLRVLSGSSKPQVPFAGIPVGGRLFIASPALIDDAMHAVPRGRTLSVDQLRATLARTHFADATCPLTTGIFLRIVAERALEQRAEGASDEEIAPFWRVIDPDSTLAQKLSCGAEFIRQQRALATTASLAPH
jgi:hypothetical protein